jgi:hypothetical protein
MLNDFERTPVHAVPAVSARVSFPNPRITNELLSILQPATLDCSTMTCLTIRTIVGFDSSERGMPNKSTRPVTTSVAVTSELAVNHTRVQDSGIPQHLVRSTTASLTNTRVVHTAQKISGAVRCGGTELAFTTHCACGGATTIHVGFVYVLNTVGACAARGRGRR